MKAKYNVVSYKGENECGANTEHEVMAINQIYVKLGGDWSFYKCKRYRDKNTRIKGAKVTRLGFEYKNYC